jgi:X-Pro dipeptidyl-peptidase
MSHAFNDWNVVPEHSVRIYEALKGRVPLQAYYHQGGHGGAPPMEMMNKWFTRFLYGVENGVEKEPKAWIVRETPPAAPAGPPAAGGAGSAPAQGRGRGQTPAPTPYADYPNPMRRW